MPFWHGTISSFASAISARSAAEYGLVDDSSGFSDPDFPTAAADVGSEVSGVLDDSLATALYTNREVAVIDAKMADLRMVLDFMRFGSWAGVLV